MRGDLAVQAVEFEQAARRAWRDAWDKPQRAAAVTRRAVRSGLQRGLEPIEAALLSPAGRDRIHAAATFALIFLFAVSSVDFLIAGGAEFGAPARAAPLRTQTYASTSAPVSRTPAPVEPAPAEIAATPAEAAEIAATLAEATEGSVTPTSQNFFAPLSETPASMHAAGVLVSISVPQVDASEPGDARLIGETTEDVAAEPAQPLKAEPRSPRRKAS
jgi:hypothetical protein